MRHYGFESQAYIPMTKINELIFAKSGVDFKHLKITSRTYKFYPNHTVGANLVRIGLWFVVGTLTLKAGKQPVFYNMIIV